MRLKTPRVPPLAAGELTPEQTAMLAPVPPHTRNILLTLMNAPDALAAWAPWAGYVMGAGNTLTPRQREIVILRVGWLCRSSYEFAQHRLFASAAGLSADEVAAIKAGAGAGWSAEEAALISLADELVADHFVSDLTWATLGRFLTDRARMDAVFTASQYVQVSIWLNSFGVQLDEGLEADPDLAS